MTAKISNPLTVVAIFSGLAEAFATVALINVSHDIQQVFVYFVMAFPTLIVLLFFAVLNWNPTVLYAPGDFEDESMYLDLIRIKNSLKSEILGTLATQHNGAVALTPQQIQTVSVEVDKAIERVAVSPKQRILGLLKDGPKSNGDVMLATGLTPASVSFLMHKLADEGNVVRVGSGRSGMWSLSQSSGADA